MTRKPVPMEITPGWYKHRKGGVYYVIGVGQHTESEDYELMFSDSDLVFYQGLDGKLWARPLTMFVDGRFTRCAHQIQQTLDGQNVT